MWKIWCKALGQKEGKNNREADAVAVIRTCILIGYMVTNCFIVAGVVRHWNDMPNQHKTSNNPSNCTCSDF